MTTHPIRCLPVYGWFEHLQGQFNRRNVVILVGSGISSWAPSGLPMGRTVSEQLAALLSRDIGPSASKVTAYIRRAAFEHIMETCPYQEHIRRVVGALYNSVTPNPCHRAVAELVAQGIIRHVITTNYDRCLEAALGSVPVEKVFSETHVRSLNLSHPVYFKIHGCASELDSLVFTLTGEPRMDAWKRELLQRILDDAILVVVGYSGTDFEICPELARTGVPIAWNCWTEPNPDEYEPSPNALRILGLNNNIAVVGDMADMFAGFGVGRPELDRTEKSIPEDLFLFGETPREREQNLDYWRCELFRGIGCASAAKHVADRLRLNAATETETVRATHYQGLAYFHSGRYRDAARAYRDASDHSSGDLRYGCLFDCVEALRCAGDESRAAGLLEVFSGEADRQYRAPILIRKLALLAQRYEALVSLGLNRKAQRARAEAEPILSELATIATEPGARFEHQHTELFARRLRYKIDVIAGQDAPLPAPAGFRQLGYFVAEATAIRHDFLLRRSRPTEQRLHGVFDSLYSLGAYAEAWKFAIILVRAYPAWSSLGQLPKILSAFVRCQYSFRHRLVLLLAQFSRSTGHPA